ncbi:hypothetical protein HK102_001003 [Quaeritorhiza haematococci]|nr:hypothetical protein HK102_001003 [Quaeritorhiza haematococci]
MSTAQAKRQSRLDDLLDMLKDVSIQDDPIPPIPSISTNSEANPAQTTPPAAKHSFTSATTTTTTSTPEPADIHNIPIERPLRKSRKDRVIAEATTAHRRSIANLDRLMHMLDDVRIDDENGPIAAPAAGTNTASRHLVGVGSASEYANKALPPPPQEQQTSSSSASSAAPQARTGTGKLQRSVTRLENLFNRFTDLSRSNTLTRRKVRQQPQQQTLPKTPGSPTEPSAETVDALLTTYEQEQGDEQGPATGAETSGPSSPVPYADWYELGTAPTSATSGTLEVK